MYISGRTAAEQSKLMWQRNSFLRLKYISGWRLYSYQLLRQMGYLWISLVFPGWVLMFLDSHPTKFTFHSWFVFFLVLHLRFRIPFSNLQFTSKLLSRGYRYHKLRKTFGKIVISYSQLSSKFGALPFQEYVTKGLPSRSFTVILCTNLERARAQIISFPRE